MEFALRVFQTDSDQPLFYRANPQPCNSWRANGAFINASAKCLNEKSKVTNREQNRSRRCFRNRDLLTSFNFFKGSFKGKLLINRFLKEELFIDGNF